MLAPREHRQLRWRPTVSPHLASRQASVQLLNTGEAGGIDPAGLLVDLVAYWTLEEASGTRADSHGSHALTAFNAPGAEAGLVGQAARCDADSNAYLQATDHADFRLGSTDFTLSLWLRAVSFANTPVIAGRWNFGADDREWLLQLAGDAHLYAYVRTGDNTANVEVESGFTLSLDTWYHMLFWVDHGAGQLALQLNGDTPRTTAWTGPGRSGTQPLELGGNVGSSALAFEGLLDEVGVWRRVLTAGERAYLYAEGLGRTYPFT